MIALEREQHDTGFEQDPALEPWNSRRIRVSAPLARGTRLDLPALIPVFHALIRERALDAGPLVDVANYAHVQQGPGLLLVAKDGLYGLAQAEGGGTISYARKRGGPDDAGARLGDAVIRLRRFATELSQRAGLRLDPTRLELSIEDRLAAPNDASTYARAWPLARRVLREQLGAEPELAWALAEARPFSLQARFSSALWRG